MVRFDFHAARVNNGEVVGALLSRRTVFAGLLVFIAVYYLFLLSNGTFELFAPEMFDRVFDNMLVHLLHGEFTVDRSIIDYEAFTRNGKTYSYFVIFPAQLRLVAMPFTDVATAELARANLVVGGHGCRVQLDRPAGCLTAANWCRCPFLPGWRSIPGQRSAWRCISAPCFWSCGRTHSRNPCRCPSQLNAPRFYPIDAGYHGLRAGTAASSSG